MPLEAETLWIVAARFFTDPRPCPYCTGAGPTLTAFQVRRCLACLEAICREVQAEMGQDCAARLSVSEIAACFLEDVTVFA